MLTLLHVLGHDLIDRHLGIGHSLLPMNRTRALLVVEFVAPCIAQDVWSHVASFRRMPSKGMLRSILCVQVPSNSVSAAPRLLLLLQYLLDLSSGGVGFLSGLLPGVVGSRALPHLLVSLQLLLAARSSHDLGLDHLLVPGLSSRGNALVRLQGRSLRHDLHQSGVGVKRLRGSLGGARVARGLLSVLGAEFVVRGEAFVALRVEIV